MSYRHIISNLLFRLLNKKIIVLDGNGAGIGNRLKHMASFHVYHGLQNTSLFWASKGWVSSPFSALFEIESIPNLQVYSMDFSSFAGYTYPSLGHGDIWRFKVDFDELNDEFLVKERGRTFKSVDFAYQATPSNIRVKYLAFFDRLKPSHAVKKRMAALNVEPDTVCIHVRNPVSSADAKSDCASIDWFLEHMRSYPGNTRFFISTMGEKYSTMFRQEFGQRIFALPEKDYNSMVDAVSDMYLLSKGNILVVSSGSTFPEISWWLGGCEQTVICAPAVPENN